MIWHDFVTHPSLLAVFSPLAEVPGPPGGPKADPKADDEYDRDAHAKEHPYHSFSRQLLTNLKHYMLTHYSFAGYFHLCGDVVKVLLHPLERNHVGAFSQGAFLHFH